MYCFSSFIFRRLYEWSQSVSDQDALKESIDHLIGALSYICPLYYEVLLELTGTSKVLQENRKKGSSTDNALSSLLSSPSRLATLAVASQSAVTSQMLLNSCLLELMVEGIIDFCSEGGESQEQGQDLSSRSSQQNRNGVPVHLLPHLLRFLTSCCKEPSITDWMGDVGYRFWSPLLSKLCGGFSDHAPSSMSSYNKFAVETATVELLCNCVRFHPRNQEHMACLLVDTIRDQASLSSSCLSKKTKLTTQVSSFIRQLILQMLLEEERVPICLHVESDLNLQTCRGTGFFHKDGWHPRFGAGHSFTILSANLSSSLQELSEQILLPKLDKPVEPIPEERSLKPSTEGMADPNDYGLYEGFEFLESVSLAAGLNVKSKRAEKSEVLAAKENSPAVQNHAKTSNLSCSFHHELFGDMPLPQSWTLAQLLQSLMDKGFPCGSSFLELSCRPRGEKNSQDTLSTAAALLTPLDIFSKQGGLAQLSMHLPCHVIMPSSANPDSEVKGDDSNSEGRLPSYPTRLPLPLVSLPASVLSTIPAHSLVGFGLFIRLPGYDKVLLQDRLRARYLLRLLLGTKQDGDGGRITFNLLSVSLYFHVFEKSWRHVVK